MVVRHSAKIDAATHEGLKSCNSSWTPFTQLESFAKRLERDPNWTREEIDEVKINIQWSLLDKSRPGQSW
jgi:hypothetical protein